MRRRAVCSGGATTTPSCPPCTQSRRLSSRISSPPLTSYREEEGGGGSLLLYHQHPARSDSSINIPPNSWNTPVITLCSCLSLLHFSSPHWWPCIVNTPFQRQPPASQHPPPPLHVWGLLAVSVHTTGSYITTTTGPCWILQRTQHLLSF